MRGRCIGSRRWIRGVWWEVWGLGERTGKTEHPISKMENRNRSPEQRSGRVYAQAPVLKPRLTEPQGKLRIFELGETLV